MEVGNPEFNENQRRRSLQIENMENIIHDMKTPISIIYFGLQQIFENEYISDDSMQTFQYMKRSCVDIMKMIRQTNEINRLLSGQMEPRLVNYSIVYLAENLSMSMKPIADRKNVRIIFDTNTEEKIMATDRNMFERIMQNLLSNAIKYSPPFGRINVCFFDEDKVVRIEISDCGIGIPEDLRPYIFERYRSSAMHDNLLHSGLGLSIVYEYVMMLGGKVTVNNDPINKGSKFCVELPALIVEKSEAESFVDLLRDEDMIQMDLFQ